MRLLVNVRQGGGQERRDWHQLGSVRKLLTLTAPRTVSYSDRRTCLRTLLREAVHSWCRQRPRNSNTSFAALGQFP